MLELLLVSLAVIALTIWIWHSEVLKPNRFPPGPGRVPFVGSLPMMPEEVKGGKKRLAKYMVEKYGAISAWYAGRRPIVLVSDYDLIKDLYKQDVTSERPRNKPFHEVRFGTPDGKQRGLLSSTGVEWQEQRRFTMRQLRDLGFGKSSMEDTINLEVEKLVKLLSQECGHQVALNLKMNVSIVNALWVLLVGEELSLDDPRLKSIVSNFDDFLRAQTRMSIVQQLLQSISPEFTKLFNKNFHEFSGLFSNIKQLVKPYIDEHQKSVDVDNPRDFMDVYLTEVSRTSDSKSSFYKERGIESLVSSMTDLFLAGTETTSSSLLWAFLFLLHHPEMQQRIHKEIDDVVGTSRPVSLDDRASLPYTNAFLMESMRMATIVPLALPHYASVDIDIGGYTIPKGATIFANLMQVHFDEKYWKDPEVFDPLRFYDEKSNKFVANEHLIPFSVGKRFCLGQSLAEKEYFLFFVGLMQKFNFEPPKSIADLPPFTSEAGVVIGILRNVPLYQVVLKKREL